MKRVARVFVLMLLLAELSWAQMDAASLRVLVEDQSQAVGVTPNSHCSSPA